ncbi:MULTISPECIES: hypothetical protein [Paenibacillus]|uniref:hypothetical protein n=1 Tax=Paenibacillus TaxID=44249 RepID=UPI0022B862D7|nr:hypothetical protein [Paenibacillus caseinilyticus]MCZ8520820.1 hypothetical protein [Paenibacillus caseinilyticus]
MMMNREQPKDTEGGTDGESWREIGRQIEEAESITAVPGESAIDAADAMDAEQG